MQVCALVGVWSSINEQRSEPGYPQEVVRWIDDTVSATRAAVQNLDRLSCRTLDPAHLGAATADLSTRLKGRSLAELSMKKDLLRYRDTAASVSWRQLSVFYVESFNTPTDDLETVKKYVGGVWTASLASNDPVWTTEVRQGVYQIRNSSTPSAVRYIHVRPKCGTADLGNRPISVEVIRASGKTTPASGTGLIYRFDPEKKRYYTYTLNADSQLEFRRRDEKGFRTLFAQNLGAPAAGRFRKLGVIGDGNRIYLYLDDARVRVIGDEGLPSGESGIVAMSLGEHRFDNFTIYGLPAR
ncbi:MAG TPA: hypothetical protein VFK92_15745 [Burkholderiales bacterium]|nr:hypothetical protein [Burkholderiales bacterium]